MIEIVHFVNPHLFFYRFKDAGCDWPLHEIEMKIAGTIRKKHAESVQPTENSDDEIAIDDTVAVFVPQWNRWVRGQLKEKASNGAFYLWLTDYGVPFISKSIDVLKLPPAYIKMNVKIPRIHVGGLIDCVPAKGDYEFEAERIVMKETPAWSKEAVDIAKKAIDCAIQLDFEYTTELRLMNRTHRFGHLKCQKPDGTWTDLSKCLVNALAAITTSADWSKKICQLGSISQPEWKADDNIPLDIATTVIKRMPRQMTHEVDHKDVPNQSIVEKANANGEQVNGNEATENEATVESKVEKNSATNNVNIKRNAKQFSPSAQKMYGPFPVGPQPRPITFGHTGMKSNRGFPPMHRGGYGNRWPRGQHGGRVPYHWEQQHFEACLGKKNESLEKHEPSSGSSSEAEDSNDKQTTNTETKQEVSAKSNDTANSNEMIDEKKNDVAATTTAAAATGVAATTASATGATVTAATDVVVENSSNQNGDKNAASNKIENP